MKKAGIITGVIVAVLAVGYGVWYMLSDEEPVSRAVGNLFGTPAEEPAPRPEPDPDPTGSPGAQTGEEITLYKLHDTPVAGIEAFARSGTSTYVRFAERTVGHIYETELSTLEKQRVWNETVEGVQKATWREDGTQVLLQSIARGTDGESIDTHAVTIPHDTSNAEAQSTLMSANIIGAAGNPGEGDRDELFFLREVRNGVRGLFSSFTGTDQTEVFAHMFSEWNVSWMNTFQILLTRKPSGEAPTEAFILDLRSKRLTKAIDKRPGLVTNPHYGANEILVSEAQDQTVTLGIFDREQRTVTPLSTETIADKCAWGDDPSDGSSLYCAVPNNIPPGTYPDDWYQGVVSFNDTIWRIDPASRTREEVSALNVRQTAFDVIEPEVGPNGEYLFFINKNDHTPWVLRLREDTSEQS